MIAKRTPRGLRIFEKRTGVIADFSGYELDLLLRYARLGARGAFIDRMFDLGVLVPSVADAARRTIAEAAECVRDEALWALEALHVELTDFCPLACPQCYQAGREGRPIRRMPLSSLRALIGDAARERVFQIAFGGGEPMAYPDLIEAVRVVGATEMSVSITTSGYGLSGDMLAALECAGQNHIQVSLNGATRETDARSRAAYDDAMRALRLLAEGRLSFGINWVARRDNLHEFEAIVTLARDLRAENVNILRYKPSRAERYADAALDAGETRRLAEAVRRAMCRVNLKVDSAYSNLLCYLRGEAAGADFEGLCGCAAGRSFVAVTPDGAFKPCSHLGDATRVEGIRAYFATRALAGFHARRASPPGLCRTCAYAERCGGCGAIREKAVEMSGVERCFAYIARGNFQD